MQTKTVPRQDQGKIRAFINEARNHLDEHLRKLYH